MSQFKAVFNNEKRRFRLKEHKLTLDDLLKRVSDIYSEKVDHLSIAYKDEDGDVVTMFSDEDLEDAISQGNKKTVMLYISKVDPKEKKVDSFSGWNIIRDANPEAQSESKEVDDVEVLSDSESSITQVSNLEQSIITGFVKEEMKVEPKETSESLTEIQPELDVEIESNIEAEDKVEKLTITDTPESEVEIEAEEEIEAESENIQIKKKDDALMDKDAFMSTLKSVAANDPDALMELLKACGLSVIKDNKNDASKEASLKENEENKVKEASKPEVAEADLVKHIGVACDGCSQFPILGDRYNCRVCHNFDLCSKCEASNIHPAGHPFLKIKVPKEVKISECSSWRSKPKSKPCKPKSQRLYAKFIADKSIPDRSYLAPGSERKKVWSMQNVGPTAWPAGIQVVYLSGQENLVSKESLNSLFKDADRQVQPNEQFDISLDVKAPSKPGRYITYYRLSTKEGKKFGPRFWLDFYVPEAKNEISSVPAIGGKFEKEMKELKSMGFDDEKLNMFMLSKYEGNAAKVVNHLIDRHK